MSEISGEQYKAPTGVDTSLAGMRERLVELQPSLKALMGKAMNLFEDVYPQAPTIYESSNPTVVYRTESINICPTEKIPMVRELTVVLDAGKWVRVFRNSDSCPDAYPRERIWLWRPEGEVHRKVDVLRTHDPAREEFPYDIETADYNDKDTCIGIVGGAAYFGQEPFITEVDEALEEARLLAHEYGFDQPSN